VTPPMRGASGFLDPHQPELFEGPAYSHRGGPVPLLVGVHHERHGVADVLADGANPPQVPGPVRLADLDLDAADPGCQGAGGVVENLLDRLVQEAA
jgi:hypothetical protein